MMHWVNRMGLHFQDYDSQIISGRIKQNVREVHVTGQKSAIFRDSLRQHNLIIGAGQAALFDCCHIMAALLDKVPRNLPDTFVNENSHAACSNAKCTSSF